MHRFFVTRDSIHDGFIVLSGRNTEHFRVLRIRQGETVEVSDGEGTDYICIAGELIGREVRLNIVEKRASEREPSVICTVYAAFPKGDKAETIVQKSVELGANAIVFFPSRRCVSRLNGAAAVKKRDRWQIIAEEAAKQSGRGIIPRVDVLNKFDLAVEKAAGAELPLFLYEGETSTSIKKPLFERGESVKTVSIMTGSEGGFEPHEAQKAKDAGMLSVSIGKRILRCETAPLAALSAVMLCTNNF
ncbi:MAG: 16S rRNA (uracil(1498)-N(3))-methyltransferase [Clostridiales bacterium]|jgi:16S rRNA (uracil1498-N3)-methyltransferase|nr:16S rRNA (uracil(1498)-N(3))-methyltransferase [Clostridiales bacterium]